MNILVAEDETITRKRLQHFLEKWGHRVITAKNGLEALELSLSNSTDILVTDWMMPEMDGIELIRNIRNGPESAYIYIILVTSKSDKQDMLEGLLTGEVDDYVVKPFDPDILQARISVGTRTVALERSLRKYNKGLEKLVQHQTSAIVRTKEETILRLLTALESRNKEPAGHVRRIALFSSLTAEAAGWIPDSVADILLAAPMHDIGKIGIPDTVLGKEGNLSKTEFDIMNNHPAIGARILEGSEDPMLQMAHQIALGHHEWWNGKGYPKGLAGEEIPEAARIVALADVYDALSHERVDATALPADEIRENMSQRRGTQFDPYFYDIFLDLIPEFVKIAAENP
ncbi:MAG: response regulator [Desulfobacterales bacterium]|nr:response regulator [Desulfobacterales bacterium]